MKQTPESLVFKVHTSSYKKGAQKTKRGKPERIVWFECSIMPGKRRIKRKALTELQVSGKFTEDRT